MNPNAIQFACGHCQSWLTVPSHLAGVSGPCPKCGQQITSPRESQVPASAPMPRPLSNNLPALPQMPVQGNSRPIDSAAPANPAPPPWGQPQPILSNPVNPVSPPWTQPQPNGNTGRIPLPAASSAAHQHPSLLSATPAASMMLPNAPPVWSQPPFPQATPSAAQGQMPWSMPAPASSPAIHPNANPFPPQMPAGAAPAQQSMAIPAANQNPPSRQITTGGSRLSLLARQLTTTTALASDLPELPAGISPQDLAPATPPTGLPDRSRARAAGDMILQSNMRRGGGLLPPRATSSGIIAKLCKVAMLCGFVAAAWHYREPARAYLLSVLQPAKSPNVAAASTSAPAKITLPELPQAKPILPAPAPLATPTPPIAAPFLPTAQPASSAPEPPVVATTTPPPADPAPETAVAQSPPVPKAILVPEDATNTAATQPPAPTPEIRSATPTAPLQTAALMPGTAKALVEVNVAESTANRSQPTAIAQPLALNNGPKLNNCPPAAKLALDGLLGFLAAESLQQRLRFMQQTEGIQEKAAQYYKTNPEGPITVNEISFLRRDANPEVGQGTHTVFVVDGRNWSYPIPVMLEEGEGGARVDWLSFIEFKDDLLKRFFSGYIDQPARFHVAIRRTHYFNDNVPDLENKECFEITNAMATAVNQVFVPKPSPLVTSLAGSITWDKASVFPIVELQWRKVPGYQWIEMTAVPQLNWYSANAKPAP